MHACDARAQIASVGDAKAARDHVVELGCAFSAQMAENGYLLRARLGA
jgi:hypothetical protein